jgi:4-hydroxy-tetrahydrodipicolinate reductase
MRIIISGYLGKMGQIINEAVAADPDMEVVGGIDVKESSDGPVPVFTLPASGNVPEADLVIDFSNFSLTEALMDFCIERKVPAVVATTALGPEQKSALARAAETLPIFNTANMSLGINLLAKMIRLAAPSLENDFNVEIIEKHHKMKADAPSGTAIMLADVVNESIKAPKDYLFGRHGKDYTPNMTDLGIHAIRGGTMPGEHSIYFIGLDEVIELKHTVYSRKVFATGALAAARFIVKQQPGLYNMDDVISAD